jgi:23S rRNA-/tRNA-specific pseudouridylate synthase
MALPIVWRDGGLLAVSKPSGLASQGGKDLGGQNLVDLAREQLGVARAAVLHRLDRNVSGLVLLALDAHSARTMSERIARGEVERSYLAVVRGSPETDHFELDAWLAKDERKNLVTALEASEVEQLPDAERQRFKPALTRALVCERFAAPLGRCALLELTLSTGRSHQIRAHLAHAGLPVVGDPKYGVGAKGLHRPLLHAARLRFTTPGGQAVVLEDPPPWTGSELRALSRPSASPRDGARSARAHGRSRSAR